VFNRPFLLSLFFRKNAGHRIISYHVFVLNLGGDTLPQLWMIYYGVLSQLYTHELLDDVVEELNWLCCFG